MHSRRGVETWRRVVSSISAVNGLTRVRRPRGRLRPSARSALPHRSPPAPAPPGSPAQRPDRRRPVHHRHHHVGEHQRHVVPAAAANSATASAPSLGRQHPVAGASRVARVISRIDASSSTTRTSSPLPVRQRPAVAGRRGSPHAPLGRRQVDRERVPRPDSLSTLMKPPWPLTMPEHRGQAQPGALAELLGGEERVEDAARGCPAGCRCRCRSTVSADVAPRPGLRRAAGVASSSVTFSARERQRAAVGHGVAGVDAQVHQHLVQLGRVGRAPATGPSRTSDADLDRLAGTSAAACCATSRRTAGSCSWRRCRLDAAGERQDLLDHLGAALGARVASSPAATPAAPSRTCAAQQLDRPSGSASARC